MAVLIQIAVAGGMLVAWVWLLGRPGLHAGASDPADESDAPGDLEFWGQDSSWRRFTGRVGRLTRRVGGRWWDVPVEHRRRQLLLGTMIASFVSFFLAIALKGRFLYLFVMMLTLLVAHLAIASRVGSRLVREQHARRAARAQELARAAASPDDIRLGGVGMVTLLGPEDEPETVGVTSYVSDLISEAWADLDNVDARPSAPPVDTAADLASQLEWADDTVAEPERVDATAERVIESEPGVEPGAAREQATATRSEPAAEPATAVAAEPIFTRPVTDARATVRSRRKPQPIHIESELDDEHTAPRRAVNHS